MEPRPEHDLELDGLSLEEALRSLGRNGGSVRLLKDGRPVARLLRVEDSEEEQEASHPDLMALVAELDAGFDGEVEPGPSASEDHDRILYGERE